MNSPCFSVNEWRAWGSDFRRYMIHELPADRYGDTLGDFIRHARTPAEAAEVFVADAHMFLPDNGGRCTVGHALALADRLAIARTEQDVIGLLRDVEAAAAAKCTEFGVTDERLRRIALAVEILRACDEIDAECVHARETE
jgi:hypothetical protein